MQIDIGIIKTLETESLAGIFYRYIRTRYANQPLSMYGSFNYGGRYNVIFSFGALYLGFDQQTCEAEVTSGILADIPTKKGAFTIFEYKADLNAVVRMDNRAIQNKIGVTIEEITIPGNHWTASIIGEPLFKRGDVEGLVAPSAHLQHGLCLDVYLDHVQAPSQVISTKKLGTWPR